VGATGGIVVGSARETPGSFVPALWAEGVRHDLPLPPGTSQGVAMNVNKSGAIVGFGNVPFEQAFHYRNGSMLLLKPIEGNRTVANDIDDDGFAVGASSDSAAAHPHAACLWTPAGEPIALGTPASSTSIARAMNEAQQVVGEVDYLPTSQPRPFLWTDGRLRMLEVLPGDPHGRAADINDHGVIVGESIGVETIPGVSNYEAVFWVNGSVQALPMPPGINYSRCAAINNQGDIVGDASRHQFGLPAPFLFHQGVVTTLEELAGPLDGWTFAHAQDIDENGRIVGVGYLHGDLRAFVLVPR
jgi:uncharacterized membrane protein